MTLEKKEGRRRKSMKEKAGKNDLSSFFSFDRVFAGFYLLNYPAETEISSSGRSAPGHKDAPKFASLPPPSPSQG